ncbi:MAG: dephospho-CoA kinase [Candidatus Eremiobacteraeota bacterium]|nr:dephospho-CoA kinase [Candidatus Eremiobacteraeota bacterium]
MIIGLTGAIGSGKTTVADMLAQHGAVVIDSDAIARDVVRPPSPVLDAIRREFGDAFVSADGTLDRRALGRAVFADRAKRAKLNDLTHPAILKRVLELLAQQPASAIVVVVVPLLFESHFDQSCEAVVAVVASRSVRSARLRARGLPQAEIEARIAAQMSDEEYAQRSAIVLRNDGDLQALRGAVDALWGRLREARA